MIAHTGPLWGALLFGLALVYLVACLAVALGMVHAAGWLMRAGHLRRWDG